MEVSEPYGVFPYLSRKKAAVSSQVFTLELFPGGRQHTRDSESGDNIDAKSLTPRVKGGHVVILCAQCE
jgi:hypothetical protein